MTVTLSVSPSNWILAAFLILFGLTLTGLIIVPNVIIGIVAIVAGVLMLSSFGARQN